jgi:hypothetical protein
MNLIITGLFGIFLGIISTFFYINNLPKKDKVTLSGKVIFDSNFYKNQYLNHHKKYIQYPALIHKKVYLSGKLENIDEKNKIDNEILVTGYLHSIDIGKGKKVTEIEVVDIK